MLYSVSRLSTSFFFFFFNDTATTEIYTLSLHDALPILLHQLGGRGSGTEQPADALLLQSRHVRRRNDAAAGHQHVVASGDRKSTRLNSSHDQISYAVFCLKKKNSIESVDVQVSPSITYH